MKASLSALIIAKDEEADLPGCLESLKGAASEIVVLVDEATQDKTEALALSAGCKTARRRFDDYASQRQAALELCSGDWVLWIDADERLTPELRQSLAGLEPAAGVGAFSILFSVRFLGAVLRHGGLGRESHVRLFRRAGARFVGGTLHEGLQTPGATAGPLEGRMLHEPYRDLAEYLQKLNRYTALAAQKKRDAGRRFHMWQHLILPAELFRRLILAGAFLDGSPGLIWAGLSAFHHWLKYVKLRELETASQGQTT